MCWGRKRKREIERKMYFTRQIANAHFSCGWRLHKSWREWSFKKVWIFSSRFLCSSMFLMWWDDLANLFCFFFCIIGRKFKGKYHNFRTRESWISGHKIHSLLRILSSTEQESSTSFWVKGKIIYKEQENPSTNIIQIQKISGFLKNRQRMALRIQLN